MLGVTSGCPITRPSFLQYVPPSRLARRPWNTRSTRDPVDPNSDARIASFGHTTGRPDPPAGPPARESVCDLGSDALQPASRTSADAAALPIFPDQVRYDEVVEQGAVLHALRFIVNHPRHGYVYPARHYASSDTSAERTADGNARVKAGLDIPGYPPGVWVIPQALKTYGMFVADNGSDSNLRWDRHRARRVKTGSRSSFEVVRMATR